MRCKMLCLLILILESPYVIWINSEYTLFIITLLSKTGGNQPTSLYCLSKIFISDYKINLMNS